MTADQSCAKFSHRFGFGVASLLGTGLTVLVSDRDINRRDADALLRIVVEGIKRCEAGLAISRQDSLEPFVDESKDRGTGTEIGRNRNYAVRILC